MGFICMASTKGRGWIIVICRAIVLKNGVKKYVQKKPIVYKIYIIIEENHNEWLNVLLAPIET